MSGRRADPRPTDNVLPEIFEVEDDAIAPAYRAGDMLLLGSSLRDAADIAARLFKRDCIVRLADDGRKLVRCIEPSGAPRRLTLAALDGEMLRDVAVEAAAAVTWVRKGGVWRGA